MFLFVLVKEVCQCLCVFVCITGLENFVHVFSSILMKKISVYNVTRQIKQLTEFMHSGIILPLHYSGVSRETKSVEDTHT